NWFQRMRDETERLDERRVFQSPLATVVQFAWLTTFLLLNYSNPPSFTFRVSFVLVVVAAAYYLYSTLVPRLFRLATDELWALVFLLVWSAASLIALLATSNPVDHSVNLAFGSLSFLSGLLLGRLLLNHHSSTRDTIIVTSVATYVFVNLFF